MTEWHRSIAEVHYEQALQSGAIPKWKARLAVALVLLCALVCLLVVGFCVYGLVSLIF